MARRQIKREETQRSSIQRVVGAVTGIYTIYRMCGVLSAALAVEFTV